MAFQVKINIIHFKLNIDNKENKEETIFWDVDGMVSKVLEEEMIVSFPPCMGFLLW